MPYSPFEQEIINKIVNSDINNCNMLDIFHDCVVNKGRAIVLLPQTQELKLFCEQELDIKIFIQDITDFISVVDLLRKNELVFILDNSTQIQLPQQKNTAGHTNTSALCNIDKFQDRVFVDPIPFKVENVKPLYPYLKEYFESFIISRSELKELVFNNFRTHEQIRFETQLQDAQTQHSESIIEAKRQTRNSRYALYVSWGALFVSLIATIWTVCSSKNTISDIDKVIKTNKIVIPAIIETKITNDTIKVDVIKKTN